MEEVEATVASSYRFPFWDSAVSDRGQDFGFHLAVAARDSFGSTSGTLLVPAAIASLATSAC